MSTTQYTKYYNLYDIKQTQNNVMGLIILKTSDQQNSNTHNSFLKQNYNQIFTSITQLFVKTFTLYKKEASKTNPDP